jgi:hypothetical protein
MPFRVFIYLLERFNRISHDLAQGSFSLSTLYHVSNYANLPSMLAVVAMAVAGAVAWNGSTTGGGSHDDEIREVIDEVSQVTPLTPLCKVVGQRLVEIAVKRKVTALRPTHSIWTGKEVEAAAAWEAARCPPAALVGIAYGSADIAFDDRRRRIGKQTGN